MRKASYAFLLTFIAACSSEPGVPKDMQYRFDAVELVEDGCMIDSSYVPDVAYIDARLRADGLVDLTPFYGLDIGPHAYKGIDIGPDGSFVSLRQSRALRTENKTVTQELSGRLGMELATMTLTLEDEGQYGPDGAYDICRTRLRFTGTARGFSNAIVVDGPYNGKIRFERRVCPGDPLGAGDDVYWLSIEAMPVEDGRTLVLVDNVLLEARDVGEGRVLFTDRVLVYGSYGWSVLEQAKISGTVNGTGIGMLLTAPSEGDPDGCGPRMTLEAWRRVPSATEISNDYRLSRKITYFAGDTSVDDVTASLVHDGAETVWMLDGDGLVPLGLAADGSLTAQLGSEAEGRVLRYEGRIAPPVFTMQVTYRVVNDLTGGWNEARMDFSGVPRFVNLPEGLELKTQALSIEADRTFRRLPMMEQIRIGDLLMPKAPMVRPIIPFGNMLEVIPRGR